MTRTVGWERKSWEALTGIDNLGTDLPDWRPGCGSMSVDPSRVDQLEAKVAQLEILKQRIHTRLSTLRKSQVAIMIERNLYLSKLRKVENYGRDHDWGKKDSNTDANTSDEVPDDGQILLHSIYDVLYAASKNTSL